MTKEEIEGLKKGDIVRHRMSGDVYVVTNDFYPHLGALAVRTERVSRPDYWDKVPRQKPADIAKSGE
jgi:hypothetical protein